MNKKGAEMSMNVIIIAAIALLVLVVLSVIFMGKTASFRKQTDTCGTAGGSCVDKGTCNADNYQKETTGLCFQTNGKDIDTAKVCCIKV